MQYHACRIASNPTLSCASYLLYYMLWVSTYNLARQGHVIQIMVGKYSFAHDDIHAIWLTMTCSRSWLAGWLYQLMIHDPWPWERSIDRLLDRELTAESCIAAAHGRLWVVPHAYHHCAFVLLHITRTWSMNNSRKHAHRPYTVLAHHILAKVLVLATWPVLFRSFSARPIELLQPQAMKKKRIDRVLEPVFLHDIS